MEPRQPRPPRLPLRAGAGPQADLWAMFDDEGRGLFRTTGGLGDPLSDIADRSESRFRTRVKWGDQYGGYGEQYYEYNHGPQHADTYNNYV